MRINVESNFPSASQMQARIITGVTAGTEVAIKDLHAASMAVTPFNKGALVGSAKEKIITHKNTVNGELSYGGGSVDYAARIHEGLNAWGTPVKKWTTPGTGAGYLSNPLKNREFAIYAVISGAIRRSLGF